MSDQSHIILNLISEHENVREQLSRAYEAIADWQITLESEINHEQGSPVKALSDKQWNLVQAIGFLEEGLFSHYQREQTLIGPFIGLLGKGLIIEQDEIGDRLRRIKLLLTDTKLKDLSGPDLAAKYYDVKRDVEATYRLINDHSLVEDSILNLLLKATAPNEVNKEGT